MDWRIGGRPVGGLWAKPREDEPCIAMAERPQEANRGNKRQVHDTQDSPGRIQVLASRSQPLFLFNLFPVRSAADMGRAWWSTTLSSKVNLPHAIKLRTKCGHVPGGASSRRGTCPWALAPRTASPATRTLFQRPGESHDARRKCAKSHHLCV